jgi:hypothetical protein
MKRSGSADLPLHNGHVPKWLAERMVKLGGAIVESLVLEHGQQAVLSRMSNPFWFQSLGAVMGMDWHSSGITTSVMGALKKALNPKAHELGIYICGGRGKHSRKTPDELLKIADRTGLNGTDLVRSSKLAAKVDNNAVQDGFQLYLHNFIVTGSGEWAVIQQGMNTTNRLARRYHWHSASVKNFTEQPHTSIVGANSGMILNLTDKEAASTKEAMLTIANEPFSQTATAFNRLVLPSHHDVRAGDVDMKRLGAVLAVAQEKQLLDFDALLLLEGAGPRTIQSLALVSEVIYGTPSRFRDPARFSFAHGGKDGHPFPVPTNIYDETIQIMNNSIQKAKLGETDKQQAIKRLNIITRIVEDDFVPNDQFEKVIEQERKDSWRYGGRTVFGKAVRPKMPNMQLHLF